jgi:hypothetical protein
VLRHARLREQVDKEEFFAYLEQEMEKEVARLQAEAVERAKHGPAVSRKDSDLLFTQMDEDGDGKLTLKEIKAGLKVMQVGFGRSVTWCYRSSILYQIHYDIRCLFF